MASGRLRVAAAHLAAAAALAAGGLIWRMAPLGLPLFLLKYGGSVLWGAMLLMLVGVSRAGRDRPGATAAWALSLAIASELFRLVHAPALDAFRLTLPGALLLGRVFNPLNVVAYGIGLVAGLPLHAILQSRFAMSSGETEHRITVPELTRPGNVS